MYPNEEDVYGDEIDGDEDKNDGLNALVRIKLLPNNTHNIESLMGHWYK